MEENQAHHLYTLFSKVNEGAKRKQGLGFASGPPSDSGTWFKASEASETNTYFSNTFVKGESNAVNPAAAQVVLPPKSTARPTNPVPVATTTTTTTTTVSAVASAASVKDKLALLAQQRKAAKSLAIPKEFSRHEQSAEMGPTSPRPQSHSRPGPDHADEGIDPQHKRRRQDRRDADEPEARRHKFSRNEHHGGAHARRDDSSRGEHSRMEDPRDNVDRSKSQHADHTSHHRSQDHDHRQSHHHDDRDRDSRVSRRDQQHSHAHRQESDIRDRDSYRNDCHRSHSRRDEGERSRHPSHGSDPRQNSRSHSGATTSRAHHPKPAPKTDYSALIPGFDRMTPAEKLRARTRLDLSKADELANPQKPEEAKGDRAWTRFVFNQDALLDEEGGRPTLGNDESSFVPQQYNQHGMGGADEDAQERNAISFRRSAQDERQVAAQKKAEAEHHDAIFGGRQVGASEPAIGAAAKAAAAAGSGSSSKAMPLLPPPLTSGKGERQVFPSRDTAMGSEVPGSHALQQSGNGGQARQGARGLTGYDTDDSDAPMVVELEQGDADAGQVEQVQRQLNGRTAGMDAMHAVGDIADAGLSDTVSEVVLASQQKLSWRERALQMRGQRAEA